MSVLKDAPLRPFSVFMWVAMKGKSEVQTEALYSFPVSCNLEISTNRILRFGCFTLNLKHISGINVNMPAWDKLAPVGSSRSLAFSFLCNVLKLMFAYPALSRKGFNC